MPEHKHDLDHHVDDLHLYILDNKSLPFMAMLRNLRNMIIKGISEAHHKKILSRLTNKVIHVLNNKTLVGHVIMCFV